MTAPQTGRRGCQYHRALDASAPCRAPSCAFDALIGESRSTVCYSAYSCRRGRPPEQGHRVSKCGTFRRIHGVSFVKIFDHSIGRVLSEAVPLPPLREPGPAVIRDLNGVCSCRQSKTTKLTKLCGLRIVHESFKTVLKRPGQWVGLKSASESPVTT